MIEILPDIPPCYWHLDSRKIMHSALRNITLILVTAPMVACFQSDPVAGTGSAASGATGGAASGDPILFAGIGSADALSPTEVAMSWMAATEFDGSGARSMTYHIYRSYTSAADTQIGEPIFTTGPGDTSYVDGDLSIPLNPDVDDIDGDGDFTELTVPYSRTVYYRVVAENAFGQLGATTTVASARTPMPYSLDNPLVYAEDIEKKWNGFDPVSGVDHFYTDTNGDTCLDCHSNGLSQTSLESWEDVMVGRGDKSSQTPNSFVIPFDGQSTWINMIGRMTASPIHHFAYLGSSISVTYMEHSIVDWANNGALEFPDTERPVFRFDDIRNVGKYNSEWLGFDTIRVSWFQAEDLESLPYGARDNFAANQLNYQIFAGPTSNDIDWDNPIIPIGATDSLIPSTSDATMSADIFWSGGPEAIIVVRALDAAGRASLTPSDANATPTEADRSNLDVNEREIYLER
jgi:hypothetical protein